MYTYLLNLTFYAGSDAPEDTDRDLFIMKTSEVYSKEQIENVFQKHYQQLKNLKKVPKIKHKIHATS